MTPLERLGLLLTPEQVSLLDEMTPEKCPDPADADRAIWMYAGERALVRRLIIAFHNANEPAQGSDNFF